MKNFTIKPRIEIIMQGSMLLTQNLIIAWLKRTANHDVHGTTRKRPDEVFALEKEYLIPVSEYNFISDKESISYPVRKDNIVLYKGNRYRVPVGTYHQGIRVLMVINEVTDTVAITDMISASHVKSDNIRFSSTYKNISSVEQLYFSISRNANTVWLSSIV